MNSSPAPNDADVLDGWKNIADYLGKSVRTAQRWRQEFGMPVHRLGGREGENVFAFRSELEAWRRQASWLSGLAAAEQEADRVRAGEPSALSEGWRPYRRAWLLGGTGTILILAVLAYAGWAALERNATLRTQTPASIAVTDRQPARWIVVGDEFRFYSAAGHLLWTYAPGPALHVGRYEGHTDPDSIPPPEGQAFAGTNHHTPVAIADFDRDGSREVLLVAHAIDAFIPSTLHCIDYTGRTRWTFQPEDHLVFGGEDYGPPTHLQWVAASVDARGASSIWVSAEHRTWFPTTVYRLDPSGRVLGRFGSNGRMSTIHFMPFEGRQLVLLGGVNNERKTAAVAVLDAARFGGAAPAEASAYRCDDCTPGQPDDYLVFPPTDVSGPVGGMPNVFDIAAHPSGEVVVAVLQAMQSLPGDTQASNAITNYRLGTLFRVRAAEFYTQYVTVHDHFASVGRLDHRFDLQRESAQLWPVLRWNGSGYERIEGPER